MNDRIAELRSRAGSDPKSRHFFPLGEELRKNGELEEAEQILREGLAHHPNYLSAWIGLGRVLRDQGKHREALDILQRAFTLDGSNVVTARLMAESYLLIGDKLEAIKKFKLVRALLPPDEELEAIISGLEGELNPTAAADAAPAAAPAPAPAPEAEEERTDSIFAAEPLEEDALVAEGPEPSYGAPEPAEEEGAPEQTDRERSEPDGFTPAELDHEPFGAFTGPDESPASAEAASDAPFDLFSDAPSPEIAGHEGAGPFEHESAETAGDEVSTGAPAPLPAPAESSLAAFGQDAIEGDTAGDDDSPMKRTDKPERLRKWLETVRRNARVS